MYNNFSFINMIKKINKYTIYYKLKKHIDYTKSKRYTDIFKNDMMRNINNKK